MTLIIFIFPFYNLNLSKVHLEIYLFLVYFIYYLFIFIFCMPFLLILFSRRCWVIMIPIMAARVHLLWAADPEIMHTPVRFAKNWKLFTELQCSRGSNTKHTNPNTFEIPNRFEIQTLYKFSFKMVIFKMAAFCSVLEWQPFWSDLECHSKYEPFNIQTTFNHLQSERVCYLSPHCILLLVLSQCRNEQSIFRKYLITQFLQLLDFYKSGIQMHLNIVSNVLNTFVYT